jgi:hypothetical protein
MAEGETQMRDARLEIVIETRHRRGQIAGVGLLTNLGQRDEPPIKQ